MTLSPELFADGGALNMSWDGAPAVVASFPVPADDDGQGSTVGVEKRKRGGDPLTIEDDEPPAKTRGS